MARKKRVSIVERLEETVSDLANAVSVAATGSELGILELAAEDEMGRPPAKKRRKKPAAKKKKKRVAARTPGRPVKSKRAAKRRTR